MTNLTPLYTPSPIGTIRLPDFLVEKVQPLSDEELFEKVRPNYGTWAYAPIDPTAFAELHRRKLYGSWCKWFQEKHYPEGVK